MGKPPALPGDSQGLTYAAFPYYSLENCFSELEATAQQPLQQEGIATNTITIKRSVDLRYRGQSHTLNIPWQNNSQDEFHQAHNNATATTCIKR